MLRITEVDEVVVHAHNKVVDCVILCDADRERVWEGKEAAERWRW